MVTVRGGARLSDRLGGRLVSNSELAGRWGLGLRKRHPGNTDV